MRHKILQLIGWLLIRKWGKHLEELHIIGDEDQMLFEWAGAVPGAFYNPLARDKRGLLEKSHRVPRNIVELALRWIEQIPGRVPITYHPRDFEGENQTHG
jgi:superfamily I DNA/RNA helicase